MAEYLFVYGTLMPGKAPVHLQSLVGQLRSVSPASVSGLLYDLGEYPGAVLDASSASRIVGHVYEVPADPTLLAALDQYEGFDPTNLNRSLFIRERCDVDLSDGQTLTCWAYTYNRDLSRATLIADGDYARHRPMH